jgi:hypothetical protein
LLQHVPQVTADDLAVALCEIPGTVWDCLTKRRQDSAVCAVAS